MSDAPSLALGEGIFTTALTLGTLIVLATLAIVGYIRGAKIRAYRPTLDPETLQASLDNNLDKPLTTPEGV